MPKSTKLKGTKKRVKVKDLPTAQKKMSGKDMEKVKGGYMKIVMKDVVVSSATPKKD